jgi:hypothetical protein
MKRASALITLLALLVLVPSLLIPALSCDDAEGLAKDYGPDPAWPCRPDAEIGPDQETCWQRCLAHQNFEASSDGESFACSTEGGDPDWAATATLEVARSLCKQDPEYSDHYHTPSYDQLRSLLDNCEDIGKDYGVDGGLIDGGVGDAGLNDGGVHVEEYLCEGCHQSDACAALFPDEMHYLTYWGETRCPRPDDDIQGNPDEDWHGRWVIDFSTGESSCGRWSDEYSTLCVYEAPDPWPPSY